MYATGITYIIDDDEIFIYAMQRLITVKGLSKELVVFNRVEQAIAHLKENKNNPNLLPDVILLDINLPLSDGWDFIADYGLLKAHLAKQPAIYMLSSSISHEDKTRAEENKDINAYFLKPLSKENFDYIFKPEN